LARRGLRRRLLPMRFCHLPKAPSLVNVAPISTAIRATRHDPFQSLLVLAGESTSLPLRCVALPSPATAAATDANRATPWVTRRFLRSAPPRDGSGARARRRSFATPGRRETLRRVLAAPPARGK